MANIEFVHKRAGRSPRFKLFSGVAIDVVENPHFEGRDDGRSPCIQEFDNNRREIVLPPNFSMEYLLRIEAWFHEKWPRALAKVANPDDYFFHTQLEVTESDDWYPDLASEAGETVEEKTEKPVIEVQFALRCFRKDGAPEDLKDLGLAPLGSREYCRFTHLALEPCTTDVAHLAEVIGFLVAKAKH